MKIEKIALRDIHPNPDNAKLHPEEQVRQIIESIKKFGFNDPIAIDENGVIIEGHGRYMALQEMGYKDAEVIRITGLNEDQKRAYTLVHNKLTMNTGFDLDILESELRKIKSFDMTEFDFDMDFDVNMDMTFKDDEEEEKKAAETQIRDPRAKPGQLWQLGPHRLIVGDSTDPDVIERLTDGEPMDLCLTDPPYNVGYEGKTEDALTIDNDDMDSASFYDFMLKTYNNMFMTLKPGGVFYVFHADVNGLIFRKALEDAGGQLRQVLVWVKSNFTLGRQDYQWKHEPILYGWKEGAGHYFIDDRCQTNIFEDTSDLQGMTKDELIRMVQRLTEEKQPTTVIHADRPSASRIHPTMKPINLISRLIHNSTQRGDRVIDLFGGSGQTMIAADRLNRVCYMAELDPHYADVIIQRYEDETGKKGALIDGSR